MIPKKNRFVGSKAIERVYKAARPARSGTFNIRVKDAKTEEYHLAVVVSKKVSKSAVVRNRIRRRVFEHVRKNIAPGSRLNGKEIIISVFDGSAATDKSEKLGHELERLFEKAGL